VARLLVLGAGFSRYAGLPLGNEIFCLVLEEARKGGLYENILKRDIDRFRAFKDRTQGAQIQEPEVDVEEFLAFLDVEHFLRFNGSDVYADEGDRSQQVIKNLLAKILLSCQERMLPANWKPYEALAAQLKAGDWVITFNYDTLVESSLERMHVPYRLVPTRLAEVTPTGGTVAHPETEVVVAKVHGSIDWFDSGFWEKQRAHFANYPFHIPDRHPIFSRPELFDPRPIVHEPYFPESPLRRIRRVKNVASYLSTATLVIEAPLILAPSKHKLLYSDPLKELWWGINSGGSFMERVSIVGFSLPAHDQYAVQALYAIVRNFQQYDTDGLVVKAPLQMVDWCPTEAEAERLRERYRFVDWQRAELDGQGFRPEAVEFLVGKSG
jgi:hypothetical protein